MASFFNFLKNLFLLDLFANLFKNFSKNTKGKIKPFSWQTVFLLSLLSWFVFLVVREPEFKQFVSLFGWFFLILGTYWYFTEDIEKKKLEIPGLKLLVNYGPWVTGALLTLALYSNLFILRSASAALVSWPLLSVAIAAFQKFLVRDGEEIKFKAPKDAEARQELVILILVGILTSCWFNFYFVVQNILAQYPSLLADDFRNSAFVVRLNPTDVRSSKGVTILEVAETNVREELAGRSWLEVQRWLRNLSAEVPRLEGEIVDQAYANTPELEESDFWRFNAEFTDALPDDTLQLQAIWLGPSSQRGGYYMEKQCLIRPIASQAATSPDLYSGVSFDMDCQPITSTLKRREPEIFDAGEGRIIE